MINTKKATKLLPSISNYTKGEINKKSQKIKNYPPIERRMIEVFSEHIQLYDVIAINVFSFLSGREAIVFSGDNDIAFDKETLQKLFSKTIDTIADSNECAKINYSLSLIADFQSNPRDCCQRLYKMETPPI